MEFSEVVRSEQRHKESMNKLCSRVIAFQLSQDIFITKESMISSLEPKKTHAKNISRYGEYRQQL